MENFNFNTPILFIVFNRPDLTCKVFDEIKKVKPKKLYIAADGPRVNKNEKEKCEEVRTLFSNIDWECDIKKLFHSVNLGCKNAVTKAISWFFENEEQGIILEDDCLPSYNFFYFTQELLEHYKHDTRVLHIGGTNPISRTNYSNSYYFSKYNRIWGWATWRRAWQHYDSEIKLWPKIKEMKMHHTWFNKGEAKIWEKIWDNVYSNKIDTWDFQWFLCRLINGKAIIPNVNLITNLGFNSDATHTVNKDSILANLEIGEIKKPIIHPELIVENIELDNIWSKFILRSNRKQSILKRGLNLIKKR